MEENYIFQKETLEDNPMCLYRAKSILSNEFVFGYLREFFGNEYPRFTICPAKKFDQSGFVDLNEVEVNSETIRPWTRHRTISNEFIFDGDTITVKDNEGNEYTGRMNHMYGSVGLVCRGGIIWGNQVHSSYEIIKCVAQ